MCMNMFAFMQANDVVMYTCFYTTRAFIQCQKRQFFYLCWYTFAYQFIHISHFLIRLIHKDRGGQGGELWQVDQFAIPSIPTWLNRPYLRYVVVVI